ncbi:MAG: hypothetical protein LBT26_11435 [Clostridiales Family XIII bacterium]|jgi:hypothetical protein|nr:hypothetical protein [Clostridiales Family XIII bacterium]
MNVSTNAAVPRTPRTIFAAAFAVLAVSLTLGTAGQPVCAADAAGTEPITL